MMAAPTDDAVYAAMEAASEADRLWFLAHPGRSYRVRPRIPGEWPPSAVTAPPPGWRWFTVVRQVVPGFRLRRSFAMAGEPATGERAAARIFDLVDREIHG